MEAKSRSDHDRQRTAVSASLRQADRPALLGIALGVASLFLGWLSVRPNRLASGQSLHIIFSFGFIWTVVIAALWMLCLVFVLRSSGQNGSGKAKLGVLADVVLVMILLLVGWSARTVVNSDGSATRVSLGGGFWVSIAGISVLVYSSARGLYGVMRYIVRWAGAACAVALLALGWFSGLSVMVEYAGYRDRFWSEAVQHVKLTAAALAIAVGIGIVLGIWATRSRAIKGPLFFIAGGMQTIPSLALFGLIIAPLSALSFAYPGLRSIGIRGVGVAPALIALTLYSLLPILQNTYAGLHTISRANVDAGLGMGMGRWHVFRKIELPLAAPLILAGIRIAAVQGIGLTAVAAVIGAGGLGWFVFRGIGQAAPDLIVLGAIPIIVLALTVDGVMSIGVRLGTPRGIREAASGK